MPKQLVTDKIAAIIDVKVEQGDIHRIDHEIEALDHIDYNELPRELEPYQRRHLQDQVEKRYSIIAGLVMEIENMKNKLEER